MPYSELLKLWIKPSFHGPDLHKSLGFCIEISSHFGKLENTSLCRLQLLHVAKYFLKDQGTEQFPVPTMQRGIGRWCIYRSHVMRQLDKPGRHKPNWQKWKIAKMALLNLCIKSEIFFGHKRSFQALWKWQWEKISIKCPRVSQIQDLRRKKYKKGIF